MQNTCLRTSAPNDGDVAQLGEHHVRNVGVVGSNPIISTIEIPTGQAIAWPVLFSGQVAGIRTDEVEFRQENCPVGSF